MKSAASHVTFVTMQAWIAPLSSSTFGIVAASRFRSVQFDFGMELPANCDKHPFIEISRSSCSDVKVIETRRFVQNTCRTCVTHTFERFEK